MKNILLIDDMKGIRDSLSFLLSKNYQIKTANNGKEGLEIAKTQEFDLIITDMIMPEMDGTEFIIKLREIGINSKIIAISGGGHGASPDAALMIVKEKANAILKKPFSKEDLMGLIDNILSNGG